MTQFVEVNMNERESYGSFNVVICRSENGEYTVKARDKSSQDNKVYIFNSELIKYYGDWDENTVSGDVKSGLKINKEPIYVFVNPNPLDADKPRIEIDFS